MFFFPSTQADSGWLVGNIPANSHSQTVFIYSWNLARPPAFTEVKDMKGRWTGTHMGTEIHRCVSDFLLWNGHWDRNSLRSCCPGRLWDEAVFRKEKRQERAKEGRLDNQWRWCRGQCVLMWPTLCSRSRPACPGTPHKPSLLDMSRLKQKKKQLRRHTRETSTRQCGEGMRCTPHAPPVRFLQSMQKPAFLHSSAACSSDGQGPFLHESNLQDFCLTFKSTNLLQFEKTLEVWGVEWMFFSQNGQN